MINVNSFRDRNANLLELNDEVLFDNQTWEIFAVDLVRETIGIINKDGDTYYVSRKEVELV